MRPGPFLLACVAICTAPVGCAPCPKVTPRSCPAAVAKPCAPRTAVKPRPPSRRSNRRYVHPGLRERLRLFAQLVTTVRSRHVFAPQTEINLGRRWGGELGRLKKEFAAARTKRALSVALTHFANSLHNPHCYYNTHDRPAVLTVGFDVEVAWRPVRGKAFYGGLGVPVFYVSRVGAAALKNKVRAGDRVVAVDSVAAARFMEHFRLESGGNNWRRIGVDIARFLTRRKTWMSLVTPGARSTFVLERGAKKTRHTVGVVWRRAAGRGHGHGHGHGRAGASSPLDAASGKGCYNYPPRNYGPYRLTARGLNFCLYTSTKASHRAYPIVRLVSFHYSCGRLGRCLTAEHDALRRLLARQGRLRGVLLDLRDNGGGNNPNWFLDWWAPAPYVGHFVRYRLLEDLLSKRKLRRAHITGWREGSKRVAWYRAQVRSGRKAKQTFTEAVPFFCRKGLCRWSNRYVPRRRVTKAPVALLTGPRCLSACDHFAMMFAENRFGPLVGRPTAAGYTGYRFGHHLRVGKNRTWFGFIGLAFSYEVSGKTRKPVEGVALKIDQLLEKTRANYRRYDRLIVQGAIRALARWRRRR